MPSSTKHSKQQEREQQRSGVAAVCAFLVLLTVFIAILAIASLKWGHRFTHKEQQAHSLKRRPSRMAAMTDIPRECALLPDNRFPLEQPGTKPLRADPPRHPLHDPSVCLQSSTRMGTCNLTQPCDGAAYSDECLLARVPPFTHPQHVACCMRCCMQHFLEQYRLSDMARVNETDTSFSFRNKLDSSLDATKWPSSLYPIASAAAYAAISSTILSPNQKVIGDRALSTYKVATLLSDKYTLKDIVQSTGRNVALVSISMTCAPPDVWLPAVKQQVLYGNPRISHWYSNQLMCTTSHSERLAAKRVYRYVPGKLSLLPTGARDAALLTRLASASTPPQLPPAAAWSRRPTLLSCACLKYEIHSSSSSSSAGRAALELLESWRETLKKQGFADCSPTSGQATSLEGVYGSMLSAQFVVSGSQVTPTADRGAVLSACEWEAIAAGAVPVLIWPPHIRGTVHSSRGESHSTYLYHLREAEGKLESLYLNTTALHVTSPAQLTPSFLQQQAAGIEKRWPNDAHVSTSKAFFPHWLYQTTRSLAGGSYLRRSMVPSLLRIRAFVGQAHIYCRAIKHSGVNKGLDVLLTTSSNKGNQPFLEKARPTQKGKTRNRDVNSEEMQVAFRHAHLQAEERDHTQDSVERRRRVLLPEGRARPEDVALNYVPVEDRKRRDGKVLVKRVHHGDAGGGDRGDGAGIGGEYLQYEMLDTNRSLDRPLFDVGKLARQRTKESGDGEDEVGSTDSTYVSPSLPCRLSNTHIDVVVPRCCEREHELSWLKSLLLLSPQLRVFVYYKCSYCLPASKLDEWAPLVATDEMLAARKKQRSQGFGLHVLHDEFLVGDSALANRVMQLPAFDTRINTKEAGAYLMHMTQRYDQLAEQTLFLHSDPASHLNLKLFEKTMAYLLLCGPRPSLEASPAESREGVIHFMHLAALYLGPAWGTPKEDSWLVCRQALFSILRLSEWSNSVARHSKERVGKGGWMSEVEPAFSDPVAAYKAGMFVVSREAVRLRPHDFWARLLRALKGEFPDMSTVDANAPDYTSRMRMHKGYCPLGGQIERLWHVLFGLPPLLRMRAFDQHIPRTLREVDCLGFGHCKGAV